MTEKMLIKYPTAEFCQVSGRVYTQLKNFVTYRVGYPIFRTVGVGYWVPYPTLVMPWLIFSSFFIKKVTFGTNYALCCKFHLLQSRLFWCYLLKFINVSVLTVLLFACLSFMYPLPTLFSCG